VWSVGCIEWKLIELIKSSELSRLLHNLPLPSSGNISLKVYDQLGKEITTLSEGLKNSGTCEINFDASPLTSGIYFYKLVSHNVSLTKKMIVIK